LLKEYKHVPADVQHGWGRVVCWGRFMWSNKLSITKSVLVYLVCFRSVYKKHRFILMSTNKTAVCVCDDRVK